MYEWHDVLRLNEEAKRLEAAGEWERAAETWIDCYVAFETFEHPGVDISSVFTAGMEADDGFRRCVKMVNGTAADVLEEKMDFYTNGLSC